MHQPGYHRRKPQQQLEDQQHYERLKFERQQDEQKRWTSFRKKALVFKSV